MISRVKEPSELNVGDVVEHVWTFLEVAKRDLRVSRPVDELYYLLLALNFENGFDRFLFPVQNLSILDCELIQKESRAFVLQIS